MYITQFGCVEILCIGTFVNDYHTSPFPKFESKASLGWFFQYLSLWSYGLISQRNTIMTIFSFCPSYSIIINLHTLGTQRTCLFPIATLQWRHNGCDGVSNYHGILNRLFRSRLKKTSKLRVTGHVRGNSPANGEFPTQMASNAVIVSIRWRFHENCWSCFKSRLSGNWDYYF